jgi:membrane protein implicated in regulation of membrane protease activity
MINVFVFSFDFWSLFSIYGGYLWLSAALVLLLLELGSPGLFFFLSFAVGCALAALGAFIGVSFIFQCLACIIASVVTLLTLRYYFAGHQQHKSKTNTDALVGHIALVTEPIGVHEPGRVKVRGEEWVAICVTSSGLQRNTLVKVVRIEGNKLVVSVID